MSMEALLEWMHLEERTVGYVASRSGIEVGRLIQLVSGAGPSGDELSALSAVTGIPAEALGERGGSRPCSVDFDPLRCYSVAEVADIMAVSKDTVRAEMKTGALEYVLIGARVQRIPRAALERRLMSPQADRDPPASAPPEPGTPAGTRPRRRPDPVHTPRLIP